MVLPYHEDKASTVYLGVLMCLRHMIPNLDSSPSSELGMKGLRGSFGTLNDQIPVMQHLVMNRSRAISFCSDHVLYKALNHNVVTASLETLLQLLRTPPSALLSVLLSSEGITPSAGSDAFKKDLELIEETASESDSVMVNSKQHPLLRALLVL
ncbi:hypothetical protein OS493_011838 [Desmophyllum pertusum]|uniref:Uncharacterized protein n=1 Tax=Desmophyllum pertusum TaxID=174260 RepID=A0A9W9YDZ0_9CNID|nr:hypothetical protein OS493_011838 [Desmophyllum pertusum]